MNRPTLADMGILGTNNGIWVHDQAGSEGGVMSLDEAHAHGQYLREHGVTGLMLFGSTTKVTRAQGYRDVGVSTIFRPWRGHTIGAPARIALMPSNEVAQYVAVGTRIIQPFNEQNLPDEWDEGPYGGLPPRSDWARIVIDLYEASLNAYEPVGAFSALPPLSPGGVYGFQHRECWDMMLDEIVRRGLQSRIKVVCLHPRPHNFPPETPYSDTLTCAFKEYERYISTAKAAGIDAWYYAGEHGASLFNQADPARPPVSLEMWEAWNRTFYEWMNPANPQACGADLFALCYWLSGDGGQWFEDSIDLGAGRMPRPSPLWTWMQQHEPELRWTRGGGDEPPEPPQDDTLRCFDSDGNEITWDEIKARWGQGLRIDTPVADEYWKIVELREDKSGSNTLLIGAPAGTPTMFWYSTAPALPATVNREWATVGDWMAAKPEGRGEFGLYNGAFYDPLTAPFRGPHAIWCGAAGEASERFVGIGWNENHYHLNVKYVWHVPTPEPPLTPWRKPFDGDYPITCGFQCHKNRVPPSTAPGVDYATPLGTPILAVADGVVYVRGQNSTAGIYLELVHFVGGVAYRSTVRHLKSTMTRPGRMVKQGELIAYSGNTGNSTGPHLHVDIRTGESWPFIDPETLW